MSYGNKVWIRFKNGNEVTLHNVTEIHYNYPSSSGNISTAFESDIHGTGITYSMNDIVEFETTLEVEIAEYF